MTLENSLGILTSFIPLLILGGIIFLVAKVMSNRTTSAHESAGVGIRRFFQYSIMLAMLLLLTFGLAGILDTAASAGNRITQDSERTALSIAFLIVGLPVFIGLAVYTARRLKSDPREQQSAGWAIYLTVALVGSLLTAMSLMGAFLARLLDERSVDRTLAIYAGIWIAVWAGHWLVAQHRGDAERLHPHLILGSAAGLIVTFTGISIGIAVVLQQIYDRLFQVSIVDTGIEPLVPPLIILVVGVPVWLWYWFRHGRELDRGLLWLAYVLLLGVLGGAVMVISGAGVMIFGMMQWLIGDPSTSSASTHFAFIPGAIGPIAAGGVSWLYHAKLLGDRDDRDRTEVDRVYDYLLSGAGLVVSAGGAATLITIAFKGVSGLGITSFGNATATALTLLIVGTPLWWRYWSTAQRYRRDTPDAELRSLARRIYIFLLFGVAGIVSVVNLIIIVFVVLNDIIEGNFGSRTVDGIAVPIALLLTAGALAWYHFAVFKEDRAETQQVTEPELRNAVVVGSTTDPIIAAIRSDIGASVTTIRTGDGAVTVENLDEAIELLRTTGHDAVVVIPDSDGGYTITPTER